MNPMFHTLYLEATRNCNFACQSCSSGSQHKDKIEDDLPFDIIVNRILIPARKLGTKNIDFSGGEFLLRKDAFEILAKANELGFSIGILSNGSTLSEETLLKIKEILGQNVIISLGINSFDEENIESRESSQDYFLKILNRLESQHFRVNVSVTMGSFNKHSFCKTLDKINELHLPFNRVPYSPRNSTNRKWMFDKEAMKNYLHPALRKHYKGYVSYVPLFLSTENYKKYSHQKENLNHVPTNPSVGCWVGSFYAINPKGDVAPCPLVSDHVSGGNVLIEDLYDILYKSELFSKIVNRNNLKGKCGKCKFRFTCGGCRVYSYYMTGDIYESDPTCFIEDLSDKELKVMEDETVKQYRNYCRMVHFGSNK
ncbi:MAG: radical SAM protein [Bacteroidia bacterium]|nr:radical SAM protein [Bacteroidia bacterium]